MIKKREAQKYQVQNQINEFRQQALQSQMNPHFIFNSLNAIQSFLTINDEKNAMLYLSKFGRLIRLIFDQSKVKLISIEEEIEMLKKEICIILNTKTVPSILFTVDIPWNTHWIL